MNIYTVYHNHHNENKIDVGVMKLRVSGAYLSHSWLAKLPCISSYCGKQTRNFPIFVTFLKPANLVFLVVASCCSRNSLIWHLQRMTSFSNSWSANFIQHLSVCDSWHLPNIIHISLRKGSSGSYLIHENHTAPQRWWRSAKVGRSEKTFVTTNIISHKPAVSLRAWVWEND